jgi:hypothetical protein
MVIGKHHHGFMVGKGTQEPSLLATHLIQDAQDTLCPPQLVSLEFEKAFDQIGHATAVQTLCTFGVLEILIQAIHYHTLVGYAKVEFRGQRGILITTRTGSEKSTHFPVSSSLLDLRLSTN